MTDVLLSVHGAIWGTPMILLILGVGIWICIKTEGVQFWLFPAACRELIRIFRQRKCAQGVSPFRALCTALGATVGTGNIIGVAGAVCLGGPGAVFWMWVCGILAMGTKYAEAVLAVRYRTGCDRHGGPMYMITEGMGHRWKGLAVLYSLFGIAASFGVGNAAQVNAVISGINSVMIQQGGTQLLRRDLALGLILSVVIGSVLLGGTAGIGVASERLIPFASLFYMGLCVVVLTLRHNFILPALASIVTGAFSPEAVTGGVIGSAMQALQTGCSRGVFTNEAGMGTASMAHASADTRHPVEQGMMGIVEVFLDTIVICTLTALVILVSGVPIPYGTDGGGMLTISAFSHTCGDWTTVALTITLCCFAFASVLGWSLYGTRCVQFLFGEGAWEPYAALQTAAVVLGAVANTERIWLFSELFNGLMAIPNLIGLAALTPELSRLTKEYKNKSGGSSAEGGHYANFHQCQPLRAFPHEKVPSLRGGGGSAGKKDLSSEHRSA